jgi:hypothetical protein
MFDVAPDPVAEASPPVDPTIEVCERHLRLLAEVGEMAMEVTRAYSASAKAAARKVAEVLGDKVWQPETGMARALAGSRDAAEAFHKVTRALRLTFALEKATAEALRDLRAGVVAQRQATAAPSAAREAGRAPAQPCASPHTPRDAGDPATEDTTAAAGDITPAREFRDDLAERLTESDRFGPLLRRPLREVVEQVCADIGAAPAWIGQFDDDRQPQPPPTRPPPEWMIAGQPNSSERVCVRRETPQPATPRLE